MNFVKLPLSVSRIIKICKDLSPNQRREIASRRGGNMLTRRQVTAMSIGVLALPSRAFSQVLSFDEQLEVALADKAAVDAAREEREGLADYFDYFGTKAIAPRFAPSSRLMAEQAIRLIVGFEVSSKQSYINELQSPIWPHGRSGVTLGIGYDIGYARPAWLREDWDGILSNSDIDRLTTACGVTGSAARERLSGFRDIRIDWDSAYRQFSTTGLPRYVAEVLAVVPNSSELSDKSLGALVSLVYNRGASFRKRGPRYLEMRQIRLHMVRREWGQIPNRIRDMKRIWRGDPQARGLLDRRDLEARLFQEGLT
jgi:hypothetical protein